MRASSLPVSAGFRLWNGTQQSSEPMELFIGRCDVECSRLQTDGVRQIPGGSLRVLVQCSA